MISMNTPIIYLAGVATPFVVWFAYIGYEVAKDAKAHRRYKRAWDKFGDEFDELTPGQLEFHQRRWADDPSKYAQICDDRSRYFTMRWQYGHTKDV